MTERRARGGEGRGRDRNKENEVKRGREEGSVNMRLEKGTESVRRKWT